MPVDTQHPEYVKAAPRYKLIRSIINNDAMCYIRTPDPEDPERSKQYKEDGILTNFTNLTKVGLTGLIFRKDIELSLPPEVSYLEDDFTGGGINIRQFSQSTSGEIIELGRCGLLVDYYNDASRAFIKPYYAESIINWKTRIVNGYCVLSLLVLKEDKVLDQDDIFAQDCIVQYRVLQLTDDGVYIQSIYNEKLELESQIAPLNYNRQPFGYIPFVFLGSENNDWTIDYQPLYDLAVINLGHYRDSCDYQEAIYICGQPQVFVNIGETSQDDFDAANPGGLKFGCRKLLIAGAGSDAKMLQANPNQLVAQAMNEKMDQAVKVGARIIHDNQGRETAEAAKIRYSGQNSALYTLTSNMSWGVTIAIQIACEFMNGNPSQVVYNLNDQFYEENADPNLIAQQIMLYDRSIISAKEIRQYGRQTGFIDNDRTDEQIELDAEQNDPLEDPNDVIA